MRFNRVGYVMLFFFGFLGALLFAIGLFVPEVAFVMLPIGGIWILVTIGLIVYARRQARKAEHERWLFETGLRGAGTLVEASSSAQVNGQPVMKLDLELDIPGQARRRVTHRVLMSGFAAYRMRPGMVLPVHVNPRDPDDLLVRW